MLTLIIIHIATRIARFGNDVGETALVTVGTAT